MLKNKAIICFFVLFSLLSNRCTVSYKFTGASISPDVKTVSIEYFQNLAPIVQPTLSQNFTEALKDMFQRQTSLQLVNNQTGDLSFEGKITDYNSVPQAIQGNEQVTSNRLTITVQVKFTNLKDPKQDFEQSFSQYADYPTESNLSSVEQTLNQEIVKKLVEDIFNKSVSNW